MEELEGALELLREELRRKEAEYEERLLQVRQEQTSKMRYRLQFLNSVQSGESVPHAALRWAWEGF